MMTIFVIVFVTIAALLLVWCGFISGRAVKCPVCEMRRQREEQREDGDRPETPGDRIRKWWN